MFGMNGWCKEPNNAGNGSDCPKNAQNSEDRTTGDLISRAAALDAVSPLQTYKLSEGDDMLLVDKADVQMALMMLPSAQPDKTPCDLCVYNPPSSGDGKPCSSCPAEGRSDG